jgi:hypothetical protein
MTTAADQNWKFELFALAGRWILSHEIRFGLSFTAQLTPGVGSVH